MFTAPYETSVCSYLNVNFVVSFINKYCISVYLVTFVKEGVVISNQNGGSRNGGGCGCSVVCSSAPALIFNAYNLKQMCVRVWCVSA
jgi:hypothetical protein